MNNTMNNNTVLQIGNVSHKEMDFKVKDIDLSVINSLRRVVISELKNVGFFFDPNDFTEDTDTIIIQNDTPLHNEFIQHRISMIPVCVNINELENWDKDKYKFVIEKENNTGQLLNVYTSDFKIYDKENNLQKELMKRYFPVDKITKDSILITKINPKNGSKFHLEAYASVGIPKKSTSYGMISNFSIEFIVDEKLATKELAKYIEANKEKAPIENLTHQFNSIERERHYFRNQYREPNYFEIKLTSECSIPCKYIIQKAVANLKVKVVSFQNSDYEIINTDMLFTIIIRNETHTLGNLMQSLVFNHFIRENIDNTYGLTYIGYNVPHPLEQILLLKIKGDKLLLLNDVRNFINDACDHVFNILNEFDSQLEKISN
jgi:DNA-directed RNA polymerase subunit L